MSCDRSQNRLRCALQVRPTADCRSARATAYCALGAHGARSSLVSTGEDKTFSNRLWHLFDRWVLGVLEAVLAVGIIAAIAVVIVLLFRGIPRATTEIGSVAELQQAI